MELVGRRFGHIRVVGILGQGGMGDVYAGYDEKLQRRVALKVLQADQRLNAESRERLLREARTLSQLEHPNICRIHDYIDGDGADLLVLELIEGKTLEQAIAAGLPRAEKLRIAEEIARVLVVAHRASIIHRDLKPENVMLTESGEVKVLDFGLARFIDRKITTGTRRNRVASVGSQLMLAGADPDDSDEWFALDLSATAVVRPGAAAHHDAPSATAAGITLGTPLYMSPEQARGERLTVASDMYAFGLLLQTLFTGKDPYPDDISARDVMMKAARGESLPMHGDRAVAALVKRLKALAPTARPTAVEAHEALHGIIDRPRMLLRRGIAAALILITALGITKYMVDLRRERAAAVAAEAEARRRRAQAENLIGFMLGDLRTKLKPVGRLDILDDVAERALGYVNSLQPQELTAEELARNSKALNQLAEVWMLQGRVADSLKVLDKSLRLATIASKRDPTDDNARLTLAHTHFWIGDAYRRQSDTTRALPHLRRYLAISDQLSARHRGNKVYELERAYGHGNVGYILEMRGELRDAQKHYEESMAIKKAIALNEPSNLDLQTDLAISFNKLGVVMQKLGQLKEARAQFENEVQLYRRLRELQPEENVTRQRLAKSLSFLSYILEDLGELQQAAAAREEGIQIYRRLSAHDPTNAEWKRNLAVETMRLGNLYRMRQELLKAKAAHLEGIHLMEEVLIIDPLRGVWLRDKAGIEMALCRVIADLGQMREAQQRMAGQVALLRKHAGSDSLSRRTLMEAYVEQGELFEQAGRREAARAAWEEAERLHATFSGPDEPRMASRYARLLMRLDRAGEARPILARLSNMGYRGQDYLAVCAQHGC